MAQLQLLEFIDSSSLLPVATPFYSTLRVDRKIPFNTLLWLLTIPSNQQQQIRQVQGQYYGISLYMDSHQMIATALAALALSEKCLPATRDSDSRRRKQDHPRYQCRNHCEYIAKFALPPFLSMENQLTA